jgi:hypothetical protein
VLRDPVKRIESHCRYEHIQPRDALDWLTSTSYFPEETRVYEGTAAAGNFYVRTLGGPAVFHLPGGGLTRFHLVEAKRRLGAFEAVLILEDMTRGWCSSRRSWGGSDQARRRTPTGRSARGTCPSRSAPPSARS